MKSKLVVIRTRADRQRGFSMIEVLVTFFVLSIGLLGLIAMQLKSVQYNQAAYMRTQALNAGNMIMDMMRLNANSAANLAQYNIDFTSTNTATGVTQPAKDLSLWRSSLQRNLPEGAGKISCNNETRVCEVTVRWLDRLSTDAQITTEQLTLTTQL